MSDSTFEELEGIHRTRGAPATLDRLIDTLRAEKQHHRLFDALLMKKRLELGLPLTRPTSLKDVPEDRRDEFERYFIDQAREVGKLLLAENLIPQAWNYFRTIGEPQAVAAAIEALPDDAPAEDELIEIALFQGVASVKGMKLFLASRGTCPTITTFDQQFLQLAPETRTGCTRVLVKKLYDELRENVLSDVQRRNPAVSGSESLRALIAFCEGLFDGDAYHIDASHLNAVVRFGRALDASCPELDLALQMAEYGSRLAPQYQYAGSPPFDEFYPAHVRYFQVLLGQDREPALAYFRGRLGDDPANADSQLTACVLVDLLQRLGRNDEAAQVACRYLAASGEEFGLSVPELCAQAGRFDLLQKVARERETC